MLSKSNAVTLLGKMKRAIEAGVNETAAAASILAVAEGRRGLPRRTASRLSGMRLCKEVSQCRVRGVWTGRYGHARPATEG